MVKGRKAPLSLLGADARIRCGISGSRFVFFSNRGQLRAYGCMCGLASSLEFRYPAARD